MLNPKVALFFLAFLPQFTDRARGPLPPQFIEPELFVSAQAVQLVAIIAFAGAIGDLHRKRGEFTEAETWIKRARLENVALDNQAGVALMLRGSRIGEWKSKPSPLEQASIRTMKETGVNPV